MHDRVAEQIGEHLLDPAAVALTVKLTSSSCASGAVVRYSSGRFSNTAMNRPTNTSIACSGVSLARQSCSARDIDSAPFTGLRAVARQG